MTRQCGSCELCCKLLPMTPRVRFAPATIQLAIGGGLLTAADALDATADFYKAAGERLPASTPRQRMHRYAKRPLGCRFWNCRWLAEDDTAELRRPDRAHYVIDISPDYVTQGGKTIPVLQIWCDRDYPDAHRDPELRAFIERQNGYAALVRFDEADALFLIPPAMSDDGQWHELKPGSFDPEPHTPLEKVRRLGPMKLTLERRQDETAKDAADSIYASVNLSCGQATSSFGGRLSPRRRIR